MSKVVNSVMEKSSKSHGKKSDKETHTPMLKIFKDIMQLEKNDPEKTNLLNEKERHRKKKQYSSSRSKTDHIVNRSDSSSSDRNGEGPQIIENRQFDIHACTPCTKSKDTKRSEDTSSCRSCALKRLATSEYACLICLGVIFAITIVVAFFMVFKSPPCASSKKTTQKPCHRIFKGLNLADISLKDGLEEERGDWDDSRLSRFNEMSGLPGADFDDSSSRGLNFGGSNNQFSDLSRIIDINKLNYGKSSERLKNFYKKLLQTDDQIKNLKKGFMDSSLANMKNSERMKRSLKHHRFRSNEGFNNNEDDRHRRCNIKYGRNKRNDSFSLPTSFVIEKKKIMIHYPQSDRKKVPKCSHVPKESKSHETEQKHPFYKHTQRLDELLDQFIDKNLPKMLSDPFAMDMLRNDEVKTTTHKVTTRKNYVSNNKNVAIIYDVFSGRPEDFFTITSSEKADSDIILGVTTVMSSPKHHQPKPLIERVPNIRKLMQVYDQDEEALGYEDLKEVLADDMDSPEDPEIKIDRNKRNPDMNTEPNPILEFSKSNPPGIPIPNWKGPLPLYPDELNTMIKQENANKPAAKDARTVKQPMFNDIEYVEDYLSNKYEKLAQAYSDYGVLEEKKLLKNENHKSEKPIAEHRVKYSASSKRGMLSRSSTTKDSVSRFFDNHFRFMKGSTSSHFSTTSGYSSKSIFSYKSDDSDASKEGIHFGIMTPKSNRVERSIKSAEDITGNESLANSVTIKKRTLKSLNTLAKIMKPKDFMTIRVGTDDDSKSDDNTLFTVGYSFGKDDTEIRFKTTSPTSNVTSVLKHLFGNIAFKQRSLKSIDIDNVGHETKGFNENISIDLSTPDISTNDNIWTHNTYAKETHLEEEDTTIRDKPEMTTKNLSESLQIRDSKITDYDSVKIIDVNVPFENVTANNESIVNINVNKDAKKSIMDIVNLVNARNKTNKAEDGMDLSDLFRMFSTWFSSLASVSLDNNDDQSNTNSSIMILKTSETPDSLPVTDLKNTSDIIYPIYDSDMIDNIGHRSRVLMSVDETINSTKDESDNEKSKTVHATNSTEPTNILTTSKYERDTNTLDGDKIVAENKTVVKRSLSDSGLVFWSDLYDDEYGVKVDPLEKEVDGKNIRKGREFMKRSKNWLQDKVKSIAENIKEFRTDGVKGDAYVDSYPKVFKRHAESNTDDTPEKVTSFAELKVKMRSVCKEAAKAVQQTRKMQVRESQEDTAANSIMQQLVRMMSDLVDYQVKQKTCIKLPADLQNFLEWLTTPNQDQPRRQTSQDLGFLDEHNVLGKVKDWDSPSAVDDKAEYLESLRSVEELIQQYGQMNDEEKSKMSGVRQYLESQQDYLTKQIAILDDLHFTNVYGNLQPVRIRRHTASDDNPKSKRNRIKRKLKRSLGKFLRNFGKKSISTTSNDDDRATENSRIAVRDDKINNNYYDSDKSRENYDLNNFVVKRNRNGKDYNNVNTDLDVDVRENKYNLDKDFNNDRFDGVNNKIDKVGSNDMTKRNLQDVYYRALSDAKKVTTEKTISTNLKV